MRFWQKIFLLSLAVLTIAVNAMAFMLIGNNHRLNQRKEMSAGQTEYSIIVSSLQTNVLYERYRSSAAEFSDAQIAQITRDFSYSFSLEGLSMQLSNDNRLLFSNFGRDIPQELLNEVKSTQKAKMIISHEEDGRQYLYISSPVVMQSETYIFTTIKNITDIYDVKNDQLRFFSIVGPFASIIVALLMLLISMLLTGQINRLRKSTMRVAQGEYSTIAIRSKDEVGALTQDFNQMTEAVKQKVEQLERVAEERKSFIDNMTHEMKTPLTSIIGFSDLLRSARLDDDTIHDYAESIYKEGQYLKTISSKLMEIILLKQTPEMKPVSVRRLLDEIAATVEPIAAHRQVVFTAAAIDYTLTADRELLKSLLYNLIDNAIKASPPKEQVLLRARLTPEKRLEVTVEDHGSGIPAKHLQRVLEPFYRVDKARSREIGGAGLGLALCAEIAKAHNALLTINSEMGKGTTVTILFQEEAHA